MVVERGQSAVPPTWKKGHLQNSADSKSCCASARPKRSVAEAVRYGFVTLPADLANALIIGLILAGLINTLLPTDLLTGSLSSGPLASLIATAISLPLYVSATASTPMVYALIAAGLSPGRGLFNHRPGDQHGHNCDGLENAGALCHWHLSGQPIANILAGLMTVQLGSWGRD